MFENLSEKLSLAIKKFGGKILTEANIKETLQDIQQALLEADVALPVVKKFLSDITPKAVGQEVLKSLHPSETLIKIVNDELLAVLGGTSSELNFSTTPPAVILVAGLQGSGKTTTVAKLAKFIKEQYKKRVMVTSADIYRPAAIEQLGILARQVGIDYYPTHNTQSPLAIAEKALAQAKLQFDDVLIIDTAGRLHIDQQMMDEIAKIHHAIKPIETLFVVDSMTGQDAANTAKAFGEKLPLTGVILTKIDGDARGGAALSAKIITGKPIKFVGTGEKLEAFEIFHPDRIASRILGMGDILGLIEQTQHKIDQTEAKKFAEKLAKGRAFDFEDFLKQLQQFKNMGGLSAIMSKMPNIPGLGKVTNLVNDKMITQMEAIISSMTKRERRFPALIKNSHKQRIAKGSGTEIQDVNKLIKQFGQMEKMMKKMKGKNMFGMLKNLQGMA
jgi:signal recognition particle subunit SRP54